MAKFDLDHTSTSTGGRLQRRVDCSLGYEEFIQSMRYMEDDQVISGASFTVFKNFWEERGLTKEAYNAYKQAVCDENHPQCSDNDTVFADGKTSCKSWDCSCEKKSGSDSGSGSDSNSGSDSGSIQTKSSNSEKVETTIVDPKRVLGAVGLGITIILVAQYYQMSKEEI